jgi:Domain of unknown function (DUF4432)
VPVPRTRRDLAALTGHPAQFTSAQVVEVLESSPDSARASTRQLQVRGGAGLDVDIALDRGGDVVGVRAEGIPLGWLSPNGFGQPAAADGWGSLRTFTGGLVTTCGLEHALGPEQLDMSRYGYRDRPTETAPLHGRLSSSRATLTALDLIEGPDGLEWRVGLLVQQAGLFAERFELRRTLTVPIDRPSLTIVDEVTNAGFIPEPHALLYHVNVGWPLLSRRCRMGGSVGEPRSNSDPGSDWTAIGEPDDQIVQRFIEHDSEPDATGSCRVSWENPDVLGRAVALRLTYDAAALPYLFQWTVSARGMYVNAFEPSNLPAVGHRDALRNESMTVLEPAQTRRTTLRFDVDVRPS